MTEYRYNIAGATDRDPACLHGRCQPPEPLASGAVDIPARCGGSSQQDVIVWNVYDATGQLTGQVTEAGTVVEYGYAANQQVAWTRAYRNRLSVDTVWPFRNNPPTGLVRPPVRISDSVSRNFYDRAGRLIGALDGEGYLTRGTNMMPPGARRAIASVEGNGGQPAPVRKLCRTGGGRRPRWPRSTRTLHL